MDGKGNGRSPPPTPKGYEENTAVSTDTNPDCSISSIDGKEGRFQPNGGVTGSPGLQSDNCKLEPKIAISAPRTLSRRRVSVDAGLGGFSFRKLISCKKIA